MGYDIVDGDPFHDGGDPGFRNEIFQATVKDGEVYRLSNISVSNVINCKMSMKTYSYSNYNSYIEAKSSSLTKSSGFKIGFEATVTAETIVRVASISTDLRLSFGAAFSNSDDSRKVKEYFSSGDNMVMISEALCMDHQVTLNKMVLPLYKDTFVEHLRKLETMHDKAPEVQEKAYLSFIESYGTHYLPTARFGAKIIVESFFSKGDFNSEQLEEERTCRSKKYGINLLFISIGGSTNTCTQETRASSSSRSKAAMKTEVRTIGSRPILKLEEWANQKFTQPAVVNMGLDPIVNLLTQEKLHNYGINSSYIIPWFLPLYYDHCRVANKYLTYERELACSRLQGCGYSDNCSLDEICRKGEDRMLECESNFGNLLTVGNRGNGNVELVSLNSGKLALAGYPGSYGTVGSYIGKRILVCGGVNRAGLYTNLCHQYNPVNNIWLQTSFSMLSVRHYAAAAQLSPNEWWITGGFDGQYYLATTEIYTVGEGFSPYVNLPEAKSYHNIVHINTTHFVLLGGNSNKAWLFNKTKQQWSVLPSLLESRQYTHAGLVQYSDGRQFVVVAGGSNSVTTEALDLLTMTWSYLPVLPVTKYLQYGASVQYGKTFIIVGGESEGYKERSVIIYDTVAEDWSILSAKLTEGRIHFTALLVPTGFLPHF